MNEEWRAWSERVEKRLGALERFEKERRNDLRFKGTPDSFQDSVQILLSAFAKYCSSTKK